MDTKIYAHAHEIIYIHMYAHTQPKHTDTKHTRMHTHIHTHTHTKHTRMHTHIHTHTHTHTHTQTCTHTTHMHTTHMQTTHKPTHTHTHSLPGIQPHSCLGCRASPSPSVCFFSSPGSLCDRGWKVRGRKNKMVKPYTRFQSQGHAHKKKAYSCSIGSNASCLLSC